MRTTQAILFSLVLSAVSVSAAEVDVPKAPLLQLYEKIIPEIGHVRAPYDLARYDMGFKSNERPSLDAMRVAAVARQNALAGEYEKLEDVFANEPPVDSRDHARWTLLQYAFGREKLNSAEISARTSGPRARLDLSRLLLKECRFDDAVAQLMELCDGPAPESRVALALLANHQAERVALADKVILVPLRTDLKEFLHQQEQKPERAAMLKALRGSIAPRVSPAPTWDASKAALDIVVPPDFSSIAELGEVIGDAVGRAPDPQTLKESYIITDSVDLLLSEDEASKVPLMRAASGYYIDTPRFHFTSTCNGEIEYTLYRFDDLEAYQNFNAAGLNSLKPVRTWTHQHRQLAANNTQARWNETITVPETSEGYYALTAQARYSPVIATQTFAVSKTALYVHAAANRIVITAIDRRSGQPIPNVTLQTNITSNYTGNRVRTGESRTPAFAQGLSDFGLSGLSIHDLNPQLLSESLNEYAKGSATRRVHEAKHQTHTLKTDAMGTATLDVDFSDAEFNHNISATAQSPFVARVETSFHMSSPQESTALTVAWAARPIYRPGELVNLKGIVREFNGLRVSRDEMLRQVLVEVVSDETKLFSGMVPISATGSFKLDVSLQDDADLDDYRVSVNGKFVSPGKIFTVSHFRVPQYTVAVSLDRPTWKQGETVTGSASVKYVTGKPVIGASVELFLGDRPIRTLITGSDGRCPVSIELGNEARERSALITAMAVDSSAQIAIGSTHASVTPHDFRVDVGATRWERTGRGVTEIIIPVEARNLNNELLAGVLITSSAKEDARRVITDAKGCAELRVGVPQTKGRVELQLIAMFNQQVLKRSVNASFPEEILTHQRSNELTLQANGVDAGKPISVNLTVQAAHDGPALVALFVENTRMFEHRIVSLPAGTHTLEFNTDSSYAPEVTITGVLLASPSITVAKRSVTVLPREQFLTIEILHDRNEYEPGQECVATVKARNIRGEVVPHAEISLGVVHEGIYAIATDTTPDLLNFFHVHSMPVYSSSVFDRPSVQSRSEVWFLGPKYAWGYVLPDQSAGHGTFGSRSGGGRRLMVKRHGSSRATEYGSRTRNDFRPTAHWVADLVTGADGTATVRFKFPDDITDWRFTARGVTADTLVGQVTAHRRTFLPLQTELALPRGLRAGDRIEASVLAQNNVDEERSVTVAFESPFGKGEQKLKLAPNGSGRVPVSLSPAEAGPLVLRGMAHGKDKSGDTIERTLDVLPGGFSTARVSFGILKERVDIPLEFGPTAIAKSQRLELQFDAGAAGAVSSALESLIQYPYGCVEQTMSRFMPAVVAGRAIERAGLPFQQAEKLKEVYSKGLARLRQFQHTDGGWGWWERDATNAFMTAYVLEGLVLCEEAGQPVPKSMLTRAQSYLSEMLQQEFIEVTPVSSIGETDLKTYVLAVLVRCHQRRGTLTPELIVNFQKTLRKPLDRPWTPRELALRADTMLRLGDVVQATETLRAAANDFKLDPYNRGSVLCAASLLEIGTALKDSSVSVDALALSLLQARRGEGWQDTLITAAAVRGLSCTLVKAGGQIGSAVEILVGGRPIKTLEVKVGGRVSLALGDELQGATQVGLRLISGPAPTWNARMHQRVTAPPAPPDEPQATITTRVFELTPDERELTPDANGHLNVPSGTTLRVELHCSLTQDQRLLRVTFPRPCGVELVQPPKSVKSAAFWDVRKKLVQGVVDFDETPDALHFFVDQWPLGDHKITFTVRAEMSGNVLAPLPELEPMYDLIKVKSKAPTRWIMTDQK